MSGLVFISLVGSKVMALSEMLDQLESWIDDFPPLQQPMRFGNKAFRSWCPANLRWIVDILSFNHCIYNTLHLHNYCVFLQGEVLVLMFHV